MIAWVMESGSCNFGDHVTFEVFLGTEEQADERAKELGVGSAEVIAIPYRLTVKEDAT